MDSKLNGDEISALQSLDPDNAEGATVRDGDLPQRLFAFNLVTRHASGAAVLTKHGERALFREACVAGLAALARGEAPPMASGVRKWLVASGFVSEASTNESATAITHRGQLWLASFEEDPEVVLTEPTAAAFALRRA